MTNLATYYPAVSEYYPVYDAAGPAIHWLGVIIGLLLAIGLICWKMTPVAAMFTGTIVGVIIGGMMGDLTWSQLLPESLRVVIEGTRSLAGTFVRIIAGGVLAGVLIESGAAESIARGLVKKLGAKLALLAITLSGTILTASGIFMTVGVVILAPIALSVGRRTNIHKMALILALSGGAKTGNLISPNPNAVALADSYGIPLSELMIAGFIPMIFGIVITTLLATAIKKKGSPVTAADGDADSEANLPSFGKSIAAPAIAVGLLLSSTIGRAIGIGFFEAFELDALFVLPIAALTGALILGKGRNFVEYTNKGIMKIAPIVLMLIGAGTIGALITNSQLPGVFESAIIGLGLPTFMLAPLSGIFMASAIGSTAAGALLAGEMFAPTLIYAGINPVHGAVMTHAGSTTLDIMPHGNYFLASKDGLRVQLKERLSVWPYEAIIGFTQVIVATILFGFILG